MPWPPIDSADAAELRELAAEADPPSSRPQQAALSHPGSPSRREPSTPRLPRCEEHNQPGGRDAEGFPLCARCDPNAPLDVIKLRHAS
jgi:hypothetical protein